MAHCPICKENFTLEEIRDSNGYLDIDGDMIVCPGCDVKLMYIFWDLNDNEVIFKLECPHEYLKYTTLAGKKIEVCGWCGEKPK
jgi:hypothetical protein